VAEVDAIEVADGGDTTPVLGTQIVQAANQLHRAVTGTAKNV
jgi:hypothetical protein